MHKGEGFLMRSNRMEAAAYAMLTFVILVAIVGSIIVTKIDDKNKK